MRAGWMATATGAAAAEMGGSVGKRIILGKYIPNSRLHALSRYRYRGVDESLLSKYVLQGFWKFALRLTPTWIAPNLLTLVGFMCSFSGFVAVLLTTDFMARSCPRWVHFYIAFVLFVYMTLDAVDGKQARRTDNASPLGQLFDHGSDVINLIFCVFMVWAVFDFRAPALVATSGAFCYMIFLTATWEEYQTRVLFLGPVNGPVEGMLAMITAALFSGIAGTGLWHHKVTVFGYDRELGEGLHAVIALGATCSVANSLRNAFKAHGVWKTVPSFFCTLAPLYACALWFGMRPALWDAYGHALFILHSGLTAAYTIFHTILAKVTRAPYTCYNASLITVSIGLVHCVLCSLGHQMVSDHGLLLACTLFSAGLILRMSLSIIDQMCGYLHIHCLTIDDDDANAGGRKRAANKGD